MKKLGIYIILSIFCSIAKGRALYINPQFEISVPSDSFVVGVPIDIQVKLIHDGTEDIRFPTADSAYGRYEWVGKHVFSTKFNTDSLLIDSAVFQLRTFDMADSLPLYLELYIGDELNFVTKRSNILWVYNKDAVIKDFANRLVANDNYIDPPRRTNYNLYWFLLSALGVCFVLFMIFVLPQVIRNIRKKRFIAKHEDFVTTIRFNSNWGVEEWDSFLSKWKTDMNATKSQSYDAYTIKQLKSDFPELQSIFSELEGLLYNPKISESLTQKEFDKLMRFAQIEHEIKLENWDK